MSMFNGRKVPRGNSRGGFLTRLRRDKRGNVLAIMAMAVIPLTAFAGCAIDAARIYVIKSRLQQACDAGVLAGRKFMTDASTSNTTLDATATAQANAFFNNNFRAGWFSTTNVSFTPSKTTDAQVAGTATATVPITIMRIFGATSQVINVSCEAHYDIADTDIIFVLDTTGSMSCLPADSETTCNNYVGSAGTTSYTRPTDTAAANVSMAGYAGTTGYYVPEKAGSRISALRTAVLSFYDTMKANTDASTHIRYGFVTYTSTVNAGKAIVSINPNYMVGGGASGGGTTWTYQTRVKTGDQLGNNNSSSTTTVNNITTQAACDAFASPITYNSSGIGTGKTVVFQASNTRCQVTTTTGYLPSWTYKQASVDVSGYVAGSTVTDPSKVTGATSQWLGCVEAPNTTAATTTFNTSSLPSDLDPDLIPSSDATRWRPMWPDVEYARNNFGNTAQATSTGDSNSHPNLGTATYYQAGFISCGKPVRRLSEMTRTDVSTYVNAPDFKPIGGTYHDTGMIWATRMIDPNGIFAADTATWPGRQTPNRVIVFLTDGDMAPNQDIYGMYGTEFYDQRVSGGDFTNLKSYHNARFLAECAKAKSLNINIWTVTIGPAATTELQTCATKTSQALATTDGTGLANAFATIAQQIATLRIAR